MPIGLPCRCPDPDWHEKPSGVIWCAKCGGIQKVPAPRPTAP